jgi:hypothetical protein
MTRCHSAYSDRVLRVICAGSPPVVPIAGEIDASSYSGLVSTLEGLADREGDVHVNLAEVAFCDLAGLRAVLWLASRKLPLGAAAVRSLRGQNPASAPDRSGGSRNARSPSP